MSSDTDVCNMHYKCVSALLVTVFKEPCTAQSQSVVIACTAMTLMMVLLRGLLHQNRLHNNIVARLSSVTVAIVPAASYQQLVMEAVTESTNPSVICCMHCRQEGVDLYRI